MSFSTDAKDELIHLPLEKDCCILAELSALTQTTASLGFQGGGRVSITYRVENAALARRIYTCLKRSLSVSPQLHFVRHTRLGGRTSCVLTLEGEDAARLMLAMDMMTRQEDGSLSLKRTTPHLPLTRQCDRRAFLRGCFLGSGSMTNPEKSYHLEFIADDSELCYLLERTLEKVGLPAHHHERKGSLVVYLKSSQQLADVLALMGASKAVMALENIRITKQMRADINRASNCDDHNLERALSAAEKQVELIRQFSMLRGLSSLPTELQTMAQLRLDHPEASLSELGQLMDPPLSKSGVNHRLTRLAALITDPQSDPSSTQND